MSWFELRYATHLWIWRSSNFDHCVTRVANLVTMNCRSGLVSLDNHSRRIRMRDAFLLSSPTAERSSVQDDLMFCFAWVCQIDANCAILRLKPAENKSLVLKNEICSFPDISEIWDVVNPFLLRNCNPKTPPMSHFMATSKIQKSLEYLSTIVNVNKWNVSSNHLTQYWRLAFVAVGMTTDDHTVELRLLQTMRGHVTHRWFVVAVWQNNLWKLSLSIDLLNNSLSFNRQLTVPTTRCTRTAI